MKKLTVLLAVLLLVPTTSLAEKAKKTRTSQLAAVVFHDAPFQFDHYSAWSKEFYKEKQAKKVAPSTFSAVEGAIHLDIGNDTLYDDTQDVYAIYGTSKYASLAEIETAIIEEYSESRFKFSLIETAEVTSQQGYDFLEFAFTYTTDNGTNIELVERQLHALDGDLYIVFRVIGPIEKVEKYVDFDSDHIKASFTVKNSTKKIGIEQSSSATSISSAVHESPFSDVHSNNSHIDAIHWTKNQGIFTGYADKTFKPDAYINRAELVKILVESHPSITVDTGTIAPKFSDVPSTAWFAPYVQTAMKAGIIKGYNDNTFRPSNTVNLAEALKMIYSSHNIRTETNTSEWYKGYMDHAQTNNILFAPTMQPNTLVQRKNIAWILWKLHENQSASTSSVAQVQE